MEITASSKGTRGKCAACDDSPVPHYPTFLAQSFEAWLADHVKRSEDSRWSGFERRMRSIADRVVDELPRAARSVGVMRPSRDPEKACSYRSQVIWEEASRRGIEMEQLFFFSYPTELYRAKLGGSWRYFQSLPIPPHLVRNTFPGIDDKARLKRFLAARGIPVSVAHCAHSLEEALRIFERLQKPVVVKPRIGSRARHTTTNIRTAEDLEAAYRLARVLCAHVLLEEHLTGAVSRATAVSGIMRGFLQMSQACLTGDGISTIAKLLAEKNAARSARIGEVTLSDEHIAYLARSGYTPRSVLERGKTIELSRRTGRFEGGETREMPNEIHPKLRAYIERAAEALRAPVVGFDIIIPDPASDPDTQRWGFLEANSLPYIDLHAAPLYGTPSNVAAYVWDLWHITDI